jgi:hypothetical protein
VQLATPITHILLQYLSILTRSSEKLRVVLWHALSTVIAMVARVVTFIIGVGLLVCARAVNRASRKIALITRFALRHPHFDC